MAVPPQLIAMAANVIKSRQEKNKKRVEDVLSEVPDVAGGIGTILEQTAMSNDGQSNVGISTLGGALRGGSSMASLGPLGIFAGALLGGASGFGSANQANADFFDRQATSNQFKLSDKTVNPAIMGKGGFIPGEESVPVQLEVGENYVTKDLDIYSTKTNKTHEELEDTDITDVVKPNSFVFSNSKYIKPSDHSDELLGYGFAYYNESGDYGLDKVLLSDAIGSSNKEISYSQAVDKVKNKFKVVDEKNKNLDLLTKITNQENKQARMPYLENLIKKHEGEFEEQEPFIPQKFKYGGKVEKYYDGGFIDEALSDVDAMGGQNNILYEKNKKAIKGLYDTLDTRTGVGALATGFATALQSTRIDPRLSSTRFVDGAFEEMSPALADQVASSNMASANSLLNNIARSNPRLAAQVAPKLFTESLKNSNNSRLSILQDNLATRRRKYSFLNSNDTANRNARIEAEENTRNLINKKRSELAGTFTKYLENRSVNDLNRFSANAMNETMSNRNRMDLLDKKIGLNTSKEYFAMNERRFNEIQRRLPSETSKLGKENEDMFDVSRIYDAYYPMNPNIPFTS